MGEASFCLTKSFRNNKNAQVKLETARVPEKVAQVEPDIARVPEKAAQVEAEIARVSEKPAQVEPTTARIPVKPPRSQTIPLELQKFTQRRNFLYAINKNSTIHVVLEKINIIT